MRRVRADPSGAMENPPLSRRTGRRTPGPRRAARASCPWRGSRTARRRRVTALKYSSSEDSRSASTFRPPSSSTTSKPRAPRRRVDPLEDGETIGDRADRTWVRREDPAVGGEGHRLPRPVKGAEEVRAVGRRLRIEAPLDREEPLAVRQRVGGAAVPVQQHAIGEHDRGVPGRARARWTRYLPRGRAGGGVECDEPAVPGAEDPVAREVEPRVQAVERSDGDSAQDLAGLRGDLAQLAERPDDRARGAGLLFRPAPAGQVEGRRPAGPVNDLLDVLRRPQGLAGGRVERRDGLVAGPGGFGVLRDDDQLRAQQAGLTETPLADGEAGALRPQGPLRGRCRSRRGTDRPAAIEIRGRERRGARRRRHELRRGVRSRCGLEGLRPPAGRRERRDGEHDEGAERKMVTPHRKAPPGRRSVHHDPGVGATATRGLPPS